MNNLLVIDGSALLSVTFFASISGIKEKDPDKLDAIIDASFRKGHGHYTENVGSFINYVISLKNQTKADSVVVCFDKNSQTTFRKKKCQYYKETRGRKPIALKDQMLVLHCILNNIGIKCLWSDEYEADDIAGSIIMQHKNSFDSVYFWTKDIVWFQLIGGNVKGIVPMNSENDADGFRSYYSGLSENDVFKKGPVKMRGKNLCIDADVCKDFMGVYPNQVVDFKALAGDTSDNIHGVKGIGEESAKGLLEQFGDIKNIFDSLNGQDKDSYKILTKVYLKKNPYESLKNGLNDAKESYWLAHIRTKLELELSVSDLKCNINCDILREAADVYNLEDDLQWILEREM